MTAGSPAAPDEVARSASSGDPEARRWPRQPLLWVGTLGVIVALVLGLMAIKAIPSLPGLRLPFTDQQTTRTQPPLLLSIQDLSQYVAAQGNFQVIVDLEENKSYIPGIIFGERTLFVGSGAVDAYVDFSSLGQDSVIVSPDGGSVEIRLPEPVLDKPSLDTMNSYVFAQERGVFNRIGDLFSNDPNKQQQLYQLAELKIAEAATESELRDRAKKNTQLMLESLLRGLGFDRVTITFVAP